MLKQTKNAIQGYAYVFPVVLLLLSLSLYPLLRSVFLSFHEVKLSSLNTQVFVGLKNYKSIFTRIIPDFFKHILPATVIYVAGSVTGQLGFGLAIALILNQRFIKGKGIIRAFIILPWVTSGIVIAISWRFMFEPRLGILNYILQMLGNNNPPTWLNDLNLVRICLITANIWHGMAFSFIIQTAGLQSIPEEIYEAAVVDGANSVQRFRFITIPLIKPFLILNLILTSMHTINSFDLVYAMTNGGPLYKTEVISVYLYHRAFDFGHLGEGSSVAVLILLFNLILTYFYMKLNKEKSRHRYEN